MGSSLKTCLRDHLRQGSPWCDHSPCPPAAGSGRSQTDPASRFWNPGSLGLRTIHPPNSGVQDLTLCPLRAHQARDPSPLLPQDPGVCNPRLFLLQTPESRPLFLLFSRPRNLASQTPSPSDPEFQAPSLFLPEFTSQSLSFEELSGTEGRKEPEVPILAITPLSHQHVWTCQNPHGPTTQVSTCGFPGTHQHDVCPPPSMGSWLSMQTHLCPWTPCVDPSIPQATPDRPQSH